MFEYVLEFDKQNRKMQLFRFVRLAEAVNCMGFYSVQFVCSD